jgi:hypothetical protein
MDRAGPVLGDVQLITAKDPPIVPEFLSEPAREVWMEELSRVMLAGISERDSSLYATYCELEVLVRKAFAMGEAPPGVYLAEQRKTRELLGIAGPRVRQGMAPIDGKTENPFKRNGSRPSP